MPEIPDKSVDMILTDLPYGTTTRNKWDVIIPFEPLWEQYNRVIKENGAIVLFAGQPFTSLLISSNLDMFKYVWIWKKTKKTNFLNAKRQPMRQHEDICVFYRKQPTYSPPGIIRVDKKTKQYNKNTNNYAQVNFTSEYSQEFGNYPTDILEFASIQGTHPTQKPGLLLEYLIQTYTQEGETVLDSCAGSFSTCIAAKKQNRKFIGMEMEKGYFDKGLELLSE